MSKYEPPPTPDPREWFTPGVQPSPPDPRDYEAVPAAAPPPVALPSQHMLPRGPVKYQEDRGSCAAFAGCSIYAEALGLHTAEAFDPSEEFVYAEARRKMGELCKDRGSFPRDIMAILTDVGVPSEAQLPYKSRDICWNPELEQYEQAKTHRALSYARCPNGTVNEVKAVLYGQDGRGTRVMLCLLLSDTFFTIGSDGVMPQPDPQTATRGHAIDIFGWDDVYQGGGFWVDNWWWSSFGKDGTFFIRYADFNRPMEQGGAWKGDLWTLAVVSRVEPQPEPEPEPEPIPTVMDFFEVWIRTRDASGNDGYDQTPFAIPANLTGVLERLPLGGTAVLKRQLDGNVQQLYSRWFEITGVPLGEVMASDAPEVER